MWNEECCAGATELVFAACRAASLPVAWNLAGGYQVDPDGSIPKVLEVDAHTAIATIAALHQPIG
jgi:hypothetical protein